MIADFAVSEEEFAICVYLALIHLSYQSFIAFGAKFENRLSAISDVADIAADHGELCREKDLGVLQSFEAGVAHLISTSAVRVVRCR